MRKMIVPTRASVNLRARDDMEAPIIEVLRPKELVEILEERGEMVRVVTAHWKPSVRGYVNKSALLLPADLSKAFPEVILKSSNKEISSVPGSLKAMDFETWLRGKDNQPTWLDDGYLNFYNTDSMVPVGRVIRRIMSVLRDDWEDWLKALQSQGRLATATMDEWLTLRRGGKDVWSFRPERIFAEPNEHSAGLGWVSPRDILRWTGQVRYDPGGGKYHTWYEVELTKLDRQIKGWYKAALLEEYVHREGIPDPYVYETKFKVCDASNPVLRAPVDEEIAFAIESGKIAAQYINVAHASGKDQVNRNLCLQFCVAALSGSDVIPFLQKWVGSYERARKVLDQDLGTNIGDLPSMLSVFGKEGQVFRAEPSVAPFTPAYLEEHINQGKMAIVGVGVNYRGEVAWHGRIRHWVVLEDIYPVGDSGWVRLYNPFHNREEIYPYHVVFELASSTGIGIWVEPDRL